VAAGVAGVAGDAGDAEHSKINQLTATISSTLLPWL